MPEQFEEWLKMAHLKALIGTLQRIWEVLVCILIMIVTFWVSDTVCWILSLSG